jgi:phosphatidylglycerol:prolipoprotein diacylglycerol transferase
LFALLFGVLGARLYHVISDWAMGDPSGYFSRDFLTNLWNVLNPRTGGLGIFGAAAGGLFGVWLYARFAKVKFWPLADVGITALPLGQAIGRWGNFVNQELFGYPTDLPWGIPIDAAHRASVPQFASLPDTTRFHPTFLYESLAMFVVTGLMLYIARRWDKSLKPGDMVLIYGILYPLVRFFTEMQRPDAWRFAEIPVAQIVSIVTFVICAIWFLYRHTGPQSAPRGKTPVRRAPGASSSTGKPA